MRISNLHIFSSLLLCFLWGCQSDVTPQTWGTYHFPRPDAKMTLVQENGSFEIMVDGQPFQIRGGGGRTHLDELKAIGGNTIRTWSTFEMDTLLEQAQAAGLKVMVGLDVVPGRLGLDYMDTAQVAEQKARIRQDILKYKDHPALLMWNVGNELDLFYEKDALYYAINDIAEMIHEIDPDHLVTVSVGIKPLWINKVATLCPAIDILSINVFSPLPSLPSLMNSSSIAWKGPYIVTEWSSKGYWEVGFVDWDAPIEPPSREKVAQMMHWYQNSIAWDQARCMGSFAFYWGNKQERTHTWFSMFSKEGEKTSRVDALQYLWEGKWPENRAPDVDSVVVAGFPADQSIYVGPGETHNVRAVTFDAENDALSIEWELMAEGAYRNTFGGDKEQRPQQYPELLLSQSGHTLTFQSPQEIGAYRLFVYVRDGKGNFGSANIPFFVSEKKIVSGIAGK
ncbi:MAG: glycoside hydrolase family 2 TIM barrel-domain containing protein [Bacteroidota bacterium]